MLLLCFEHPWELLSPEVACSELALPQAEEKIQLLVLE
jgi:hypothetical protein